MHFHAARSASSSTSTAPGRVTTTEAIQLLGVSRPTAIRHLQNLVDAGLGTRNREDLDAAGAQRAAGSEGSAAPMELVAPAVGTGSRWLLGGLTNCPVVPEIGQLDGGQSQACDVDH
jgi:hypothetical protein